MNVTEKLAMLHGHKGIYVGNIVGNERLNIPSINMHDGPQGFRVTTTTGPEGSTTAWPAALTAASSWDTDIIYRLHSAMATDAMKPRLSSNRYQVSSDFWDWSSAE